MQSAFCKLIYYLSQTYKDWHLFGNGVSSCMFLACIYTDQEHTRTDTFSKCVGNFSDLKRCESLYVPEAHVILWGTYKDSHLFMIPLKQCYQIRCESLYVPFCIYKDQEHTRSHTFSKNPEISLTPFQFSWVNQIWRNAVIIFLTRILVLPLTRNRSL